MYDKNAEQRREWIRRRRVTANSICVISGDISMLHSFHLHPFSMSSNGSSDSLCLWRCTYNSANFIMWVYLCKRFQPRTNTLPAQTILFYVYFWVHIVIIAYSLHNAVVYGSIIPSSNLNHCSWLQQNNDAPVQGRRTIDC